MIEVKNLIFEYPTHRALNDISFTVKKGSVTALVGPNGAGKTTLMRCLTALFAPYSGEIKINGIDILENPRAVNEIVGYMPDFFGLYDSLTVRQSLNYFALAYQVIESSVDERINTVAKQIGLHDKLDEKLSNLSRGMRQRVAIGQAIIHNPELLILDEPASGLDPEARSSLASLFKLLNNEGMTIIVSSHILSELDEYASNLIMLRNGKISTNEESLAQKKQFVIKVDSEMALLLESLNQLSEVKILSSETNSCIVELDDISQASLLQMLIKNGVLVSEIYEKKTNLQEQYMHLVQTNK